MAVPPVWQMAGNLVTPKMALKLEPPPKVNHEKCAQVVPFLRGSLARIALVLQGLFEMRRQFIFANAGRPSN